MMIDVDGFTDAMSRIERKGDGKEDKVMIHWAAGTVRVILSDGKGMQELLVEIAGGPVERAIHYKEASVEVTAGDQVLLNTTAVDLKLGTGGFHFVAAILRDGSWIQTGSDGGCMEPSRTKQSLNRKDLARQGHMIKLRYTPFQQALLSVEEPSSPHHGLFHEGMSLEGAPVLIGELHSMLPVALCWLQYRRIQSLNCSNSEKLPKIVYVMSDGAALPIAYSRHVSKLHELGWLDATVTYGQAYGGTIEAVNKFSALLAAKHAAEGDFIFASMGPGIAGTGTWYGHTGLEAGELVNAVLALGGHPVVIPRVSFADRRERHRGISHHTLASLQNIALGRAIVPMAAATGLGQEKRLYRQLRESGIEAKHEIALIHSVGLEAVTEAVRLYTEPITSMGRGLDEDPWYFLSICAAVEWVWQHEWQGKRFSRIPREVRPE